MIERANTQKPVPVAVLSATDPGPVPVLAAPVKGVAAAIGTSNSSVFEMLARGDIEAVKLGGRTLVVWQSVIDYLARAPRWRSGSEAARTAAATQARKRKREVEQAA